MRGIAGSQENTVSISVAVVLASLILPLLLSAANDDEGRKDNNLKRHDFNNAPTRDSYYDVFSGIDYFIFLWDSR